MQENRGGASLKAVSEAIGGQSAAASQRRHGNFLVGMIFVGYVLNFVDRQIVTVMLESIKAELAISDGKLGLLTGLAFAILYAIAGVPIATLADRYSRKSIIAGCMAFWSGATMAFGLAQTFPQMLIARMAVGVGEAGFAPAAFSMLADYFPQERRTMATALAAMGAMLGTMIGLGAGGYISHHFGWRAAMLIAGGPGLVFSAIFFLMVRDPRRGMSGGAAVVDGEPGRHAWELVRNPSYVFVVLSSTASCFVVIGTLHWMPTFFMRSHESTAQTAGMMLGPLLGVMGAISLLFSGLFVDRLTKRDIRWVFWLPAGFSTLALPALVGSLLAPDRVSCLVLFGVAYFGMMFFNAPTIAIVQYLVPLPLRARATAIYFLVTTLVGFGLGPVAVGYGSQAFEFAGTESLRWGLLLVSPILLLSSALLAMGAWRLPDRVGTSGAR